MGYTIGLVISMEMVFKKVFTGIIVDEYHDHGIRLGYSWIPLVMTITVCELENHVML